VRLGLDGSHSHIGLLSVHAVPCPSNLSLEYILIALLGDNQTRAQPHTSWNDTLLGAVRDLMSDMFASTIGSTGEDLEAVNREVQSVLTEIASQVERKPRAQV
jgi:hypothetical protein